MLGHVDKITRNLIIGWAANPDLPTEEVQLIVRIDGFEIAHIRANLERSGLRTVFAGATGYYGFSFNLSPPLDLFSEHEVEIVFAHDGTRVLNGRQILPAVSKSRDLSDELTSRQLVPVLVSSTGRSGSSVFMAKLLRHPEIAVGGEHPYEVLLLSYYAVALRTLLSQSDRERSLTPDDILTHQSAFHLGFNPFNDQMFGRHGLLEKYWNEYAPNSVAACFADLIDTYYRSVAKVSGKPDVKLFAEKSQPVGFVKESVSFMFGEVKEIVLVRDPRDLLCSAKAFWHLDTTAAMENIYSQLQYIKQQKRMTEEGTLFVRYEDLVFDQEKTFAEVFQFLGIEATTAVEEDSAGDTFTRHGTSASPERSVGRWRTDLSVQELALCLDKFGGFIQEFGYDT